MSLKIQRFLTRCRASPAPAVRRTALETVVRKEFAAECARRLEGSHPPGLVRLRDLRLRVKISREDFSAGRLPALWAESFAAELAGATASGGDGVVCAENRTAWFATFIADLLAGRAKQRWEYAEFRELFELDLSAAILRLLGDRPEETAPVLELLARRGSLPRLLSAFDETTLEPLFALVAQGLESAAVALEPEDLILVARLVIADRERPGASPLATRRRALRLWLARSSSIAAGDAATRFQALDDVLILLKCLDWLRAAELDLDSVGSHVRGAPVEHAPELLLAIKQRVSEALLHTMHSLFSGPDREENAAVLELRTVVSELAPPSDWRASLEPPWLESNGAGLLLLIGVIERLGWRVRAHRSLQAMGGSDAEMTFFAALGLAVLGRYSEVPECLDPAIAIFAGRLGDADSSEVRRFLEDGASEGRRRLLLALLDDFSEDLSAVESWSATMDLLASRLIRVFARRLRGFGEARRAFVVTQFLAIPGRIRIEEQRIQVILAPQPLHVVLHLAGMDATLESVTWLGGRRLQLQLDGL